MELLTKKVAEYIQGRFKQSELALSGLLAGHNSANYRGENAIIINTNDYLCVESVDEIRRKQSDALLVSKTKKQLYQSPVISFAISQVNPQCADDDEYTFERTISALFRKSAHVGQSGFAINEGVISVFCKEQNVYVDKSIHASFWQGLSSTKKANVFKFNHNDVKDLDEKITQNGAGVVLVETIYSADGSVAPIRAIHEISTIHASLLIVDESHSLGLYGPDGLGICAELGIAHLDNLIITASLSKAFVTRAGLLLCQKDFMHYFVEQSVPGMFSSCLLYHEKIRLIEVLKWITSPRGQEMRDRLASMCRRFMSELKENEAVIPRFIDGCKYDVDWSPIFAVATKMEPNVCLMRDAMEYCGVFPTVFVWPATPRGLTLCRLTLNAGLTDEQFNKVLEATKLAIKYATTSTEASSPGTPAPLLHHCAH